MERSDPEDPLAAASPMRSPQHRNPHFALGKIDRLIHGASFTRKRVEEDISWVQVCFNFLVQQLSGLLSPALLPVGYHLENIQGLAHECHDVASMEEVCMTWLPAVYLYWDYVLALGADLLVIAPVATRTNPPESECPVACTCASGAQTACPMYIGGQRSLYAERNQPISQPLYLRHAHSSWRSYTDRLHAYLEFPKWTPQHYECADRPNPLVLSCTMFPPNVLTVIGRVSGIPDAVSESDKHDRIRAYIREIVRKNLTSNEVEFGIDRGVRAQLGYQCTLLAAELDRLEVQVKLLRRALTAFDFLYGQLFERIVRSPHPFLSESVPSRLGAMPFDGHVNCKRNNVRFAIDACAYWIPVTLEHVYLMVSDIVQSAKSMSPTKFASIVGQAPHHQHSLEIFMQPTKHCGGHSQYADAQQTAMSDVFKGLVEGV